MSKLNVGIADDNELMVHLLSDIVARDEELQVVGTACKGAGCRSIRYCDAEIRWLRCDRQS